MTLDNLQMRNCDDFRESGLDEILITTIENNNQLSFNTKKQSNSWGIFLFQDGIGEHLIDFKTYKIEQQSIHFVLPFQWHQLNSDEKSKGIFIDVPIDIVNNSMEINRFAIKLWKHAMKGRNPILQLNEQMFLEFKELVLLMTLEYKRNSEVRLHILKNYMSIFFCKCSEELKHESSIDASDLDLVILNNYKILVEENFRTSHKIVDYLKLLKLNYRQLSLVCSHYLNLSPSQYLYNRIVVEAKRLLLHSSMCQKQIADYLNFTDVPHFVKFFKSRVTVTPYVFKDQFKL